jgi:hypothetical protein
MQTDIWFTEETACPKQCPLCSEPFKSGSTTCFSCGFSTKSPTGTSVWIDPAVYGFLPSSAGRQPHQAPQQTSWKYKRELSQPRKYSNPTTPIPPRASAHAYNARRSSIVKPDIQSISEAPTHPELYSRSKATRRLPRIDEVSTTPPASNDPLIKSSKALVPIHFQNDITLLDRPEETAINIRPPRRNDAISWTAGEASLSSQAQLISSRSKRKHSHATITLTPIDHVRWWLLRPGHIEFVLWFGGTILLVVVTCVLLLVTAFSFEWITPGIIDTASTKTSGASAGSEQQATVIATSEMFFLRSGTGPIFPGQSISIHGQGFSPNGRISFLFDGTQQLFDLNGHSAFARANAQGVFATTIVLNSNLPWHSGPHFITAHDLTTNRTARLSIILAPNSMGKSTSSTPVPSYPPVVTAPALTPIPTVTGGQPIPVGQTPVPITPTPRPGTPTATPTVGITPSVTPTVGTTPTVVPTTGTTPGVATSAGTRVGSELGNALDHTEDSSPGNQLMRLSPWVWLMISCYCLSMILLGLAGVLYKRHQ